MVHVKGPRAMTWRCPSCATRSPARRQFSVSASLTQLGPESPRFIDVPEPPQQQKPPKRFTRGFLPVPRDLFKPSRGGTQRVTQGSLEAATQSAEKPLGSTSQRQAKLNEWRSRMTELRKQNLREGLMSLKTRRDNQTARTIAQQIKKREERQKYLDQSEREDERLTSPTIAALLKHRHSGILPDPNREERLAAMRERVAQKELRRARDRNDALHTLYMQARNFIVTEDQLSEHVDEVFGTEEQPVDFGAGGPSIWHEGKPPTIRTLLMNASGLPGARHESDAQLRIWTQRLEKVAGELTGGKM